MQRAGQGAGRGPVQHWAGLFLAAVKTTVQQLLVSRPLLLSRADAQLGTRLAAPQSPQPALAALLFSLQPGLK